MKSMKSITDALALLVVVSLSWGAFTGVEGTVVELERRGEFKGLLMPRTLTNLQNFPGALGGIVASAITNSGDSSRPFEVDGSNFTDFASAATRSCNNQHNRCADLSNSGGQSFSVGDCDAQQTACTTFQSSAPAQSFQVVASEDANFQFFCNP